MTKLCDLGPSDSVCSVQWTREGSYISIGTHLGQVQVHNSLILTKSVYTESVLSLYTVETKPKITGGVTGVGWNSGQEGPNHERTPNKDRSPGLELADIIFWK